MRPGGVKHPPREECNVIKSLSWQYALSIHPYPLRSIPIRPQTAGMSTPATKTVARRIAADLIGISPNTLRRWNVEGRGPRVAAKLGTAQQSRTLYSVTEIERWKRDPVAYERRHRGPRS